MILKSIINFNTAIYKTKLFVTLLVIVSIISCKTEENYIYDFSTINSEEKLDSIIRIMDVDTVMTKNSQFYKEIKAKGMHYNEVPINSIIKRDDGLVLFLDSIKPFGKSLLGEVTNLEGKAIKEVGEYADSVFVWKNSLRKIELSNYGTTYESLKVIFFKQYDSPVVNLYKKIEKFENEPEYILTVKSGYDNCKVILNDIIITDIELNEEIEVPINKYLLNKEANKIELEVLSTEISKGSDFTDDFIVNVSIKDKKRGNPIDVNSLGISVANDPKKTLIQFSFNSKIPYQLEGWSNGEDLRKVKDLEQKVIALYNKLGKAFLEKDMATLNDLFIQKEFEVMQTTYNNDYEINRYNWEKYLETALETYRYTVSNEFKIEINANGRLIYTYPDLSDMLILTGKGVSENFNYFLYMPKGSNELKIIR